MKVPTSKELRVLNTWPEGTVGHAQEEEVIETLLILCNRNGFGRIPQLANQIEDIWRHPEKLTEYKKQIEDFKVSVADARNYFAQRRVKNSL